MNRILAFASYFILFTYLSITSCSSTPQVKEAELEFKIDSLSLTTEKNERIYFNYNINRDKIVGVIENDGIPGSKFFVKFFFPKGVNPISITPDITKLVDFTSPVKFDVKYSNSVTTTYEFTLTELALDPSKLVISSIDVLTNANADAGIKLSRTGTEYIGLTTAVMGAPTYKLKFNFPSAVTPLSISPDPSVARDYNKGVAFTVKYTNEVSKSYNVKIANYDPNQFNLTTVRGVWVSNVASNVLRSKAGIEECVNLCADLGINTIFMVTYNNSKTMYKSQVMKDYFNLEIDPVYAGRDPLAEMIAAAKPKGIKVVAWFEYGFASVYGDASGGSIINKYPSWASRDASGKITEKNNFYWLDAFNPDVQEFMSKLMTEVVIKYPDIAGVQGDDRLPATPSNGGYNQSVVDAYKTETGRTAPLNFNDSQWVKWRADKLSDFGGMIYKNIKALGSQYMVSMSPSPYSWGLENYLQDWPEWLRRKQVDYLHPQLYRYDFASYKSTFDANYATMAPFENKEKIFSPGVLLGTGSGDGITPAILDEILKYNRSRGVNGETYFYFERILQNKGFQDVIKKNNN